MTAPAPQRIGGRVNEVLRIGDAVRRRAGAWSATVHRLLDHLHGAGFTAAPRPLGIDSGFETLSYIEGIAGEDPLPPPLASEATLASIGALLRAYHDASAGFVTRDTDQWFLPPREPREVICHGDLSADNIVFSDARARALIDFDCAHPGPRAWDLGWAAYALVPLRPTVPATTQAARLEVFCSAYGTGAASPANLVRSARERLVRVARDVEELAAAGVPAFVASAAAQDPARFRDHAAHLGVRAAQFDAEAGPAVRYEADLCAMYLELVTAHDYRADRFLELVTELGGVEATNRALDMVEPPGGFARLRALGALACSVEARCLEPGHRTLFSEARLATARARLAAADFSAGAAPTIRR